MAEDLKGLIEKIQEEGVAVAAAKRAEIEGAARTEAAGIIAAARKEAARLIDDAQRETARMEAAGRAGLSQAGRDLIISLRKEIAATLDRVLKGAVDRALKPDETAHLIRDLIRGSVKDGAEVVISVRKDDLEKIGHALAREFGEEARKGITLRHTEDVGSGFTISYDGGRSHYDFSDAALVEYIGAFLKPKLLEIMKAGL